MNKLNKLIMTVSVLVLASCAAGKRDEPTTYSLRPAEDISAQACKKSTSIEITEPSSAPGLDLRRIAILEGEKFNYYTGARWAAPVPQMVQHLLVDGFERAKAFKSVSTDVEQVNADVSLIVDIKDFQVTNVSSSEIKIRLVAKLVDAKTRKVVANTSVERKTKAASNKMVDIVASFNSATSEIIREIIKASASGGCR